MVSGAGLNGFMDGFRSGYGVGKDMRSRFDQRKQTLQRPTATNTQTTTNSNSTSRQAQNQAAMTEQPQNPYANYNPYSYGGQTISYDGQTTQNGQTMQNGQAYVVHDDPAQYGAYGQDQAIIVSDKNLKTDRRPVDKNTNWRDFIHAPTAKTSPSYGQASKAYSHGLGSVRARFLDALTRQNIG